MLKVLVAALLCGAASAQYSKVAVVEHHPLGCGVPSPNFAPMKSVLQGSCAFDTTTNHYQKYECFQTPGSIDDMIRKTYHESDTCDDGAVGSFSPEEFPVDPSACNPDGTTFGCVDSSADSTSGPCITMKHFSSSSGGCSDNSPTQLTQFPQDQCVKTDDGSKRYLCTSDGRVEVRDYTSVDGCFGTPNSYFLEADTCYPDDSSGGFFSFSCSCDYSFEPATIPMVGAGPGPGPAPTISETQFVVSEQFDDAACENAILGVGIHPSHPFEYTDDGFPIHMVCTESGQPMSMVPGLFLQPIPTACHWDEDEQRYTKISCQSLDDNVCTRPWTSRSDYAVMLKFNGEQCYGGASAFYFAKKNHCINSTRDDGIPTAAPVWDSWMLVETGPNSAIRYNYSGPSCDATSMRGSDVIDRTCNRLVYDDLDGRVMAGSTHCAIPYMDEQGFFPSQPDCDRIPTHDSGAPAAYWHPEGGFITDSPDLAGDTSSPVHTEPDGRTWYTLRADLQDKLEVAPWVGTHCHEEH